MTLESARSQIQKMQLYVTYYTQNSKKALEGLETKALILNYYDITFILSYFNSL